MLAAEIRAKRREGLRSVSRWQWHLDEVFVRVNGVQHDLCAPSITRARCSRRK